VYEITGKRGKGSDLLHAVEAMVSVGDQGGLAFSGAKTIPLSLVTPKRPNVIIELHHIYGGAKLTDNQIIATVGEPFTILFRLRSQSPVPVVIALEHSGQEYNVNPFTLPSPLTVTRSQFGNEHAPTVIEMGDDWLNALPEGPVRRVFEHIDRHGSITTPELVNLLGSPRAARRFDKNLSDHCELTPFGVSVQTENSVKRYTKTQG
jgi:hypothetical protein